MLPEVGQPDSANPRLRVRVAGLVLLSLLLVAPPVDAQQELSEDVRFAAGLRERRLFQLAESFCAGRLAEQQLDPVARVDLVIELIKTYAQHAVNSPPEKRAELWASAQTAAREFMRVGAKGPRVFLVRMQEAMGVLAQGELARQEAEVGGRVNESIASARLRIRESTRLLEQLNKDLTSELPLRRRRQLRDGELTPDELFALQNNVRLQLARGFRNQAMCYAEGSDDRIASLGVALEHLNAPLRVLAADDPLTWRVNMDRVVCLRLQKNYARAQRVLTPLLRDPSPPEIQRRAAAEAARLFLAAQRPKEAWTFLEKAGQGEPDLDYARLETLIALLKSQPDKQQADAIRQDALKLVSKIEDQYGPYWGRRASQRLVLAAGETTGGGNLEILRRTAETLYLKGRMTEAIAAYDKASKQALADKAPAEAFRFGIAAAQVEAKRGQLRAQLDRLRRLGLSMTEYERSGAAHQAAITICIQMAKQDSKLLPLYEELLQEHLDHWVDGGSADQVRMWLGQWKQNQRDWEAAISAYSGVSLDSAHMPEAARSASICWTARLEEEQKGGKPISQIADRAASFFETILLDDVGALPRSWTDLHRAAAVASARIRIRFRQNDFPAAERLLQEALASSPDADPAWKLDARALLVAALAGQPKRVALAEQLMASIGSASPEQLLRLLANLQSIGETAPAAMRISLYRLQLQAVQLLEPRAGQLDARDRQRLAMIRAESLLTSGQAESAVQLFAQLAKDHPRNSKIQIGYAEALARERATWPRALQQWRVVAGRSPKNTETWFRARYQVALMLVQLEMKREAAERIRYIQATSDLKPPWKARFQSLLDRCR